MKKLLLVFTLIALTALAGCGTVLPGGTPQLTPGGNYTALGDAMDKLASGNLKAAALAERNGYAPRGAARRGIAAWIAGCKKALHDAVPVMTTENMDPIELAEYLEEKAGEGLPANVKILCAPIPIPKLL